MQGIYCIENKINGRKYYGSSVYVEERMIRHLKELRAKRHHNIFLSRAFEKYGEENFNFYIVEETHYSDRDHLLQLEQKYIDENVGGYNMAPANGGDLLTNHPNKEDIIRRATESNKKRNSELSEEEHRKKFVKYGEDNPNWRNGGVCRKKCPICNEVRIESKYKTCANCRDRTGENNPFYGKKHSEESLNKMRESQNERYKNVPKLDPSEYDFTFKYEITYPDGSVKEIFGAEAIAKEFNCSITNVMLTIERMAKGIEATKRSRFYQHTIKVVPR